MNDVNKIIQRDLFDVRAKIAKFHTEEPGMRWVVVAFDNRDDADIAMLVEYLDSNGFDYTVDRHWHGSADPAGPS